MYADGPLASTSERPLTMFSTKNFLNFDPLVLQVDFGSDLNPICSTVISVWKSITVHPNLYLYWAPFYVNDMPDIIIHSLLYIFAYDTKFLKSIASHLDSLKLQHD